MRPDVPQRRVQRKRSKGWVLPHGAIVVTRPSQWGNPFRIYQPKVLSGAPLEKPWWVDMGEGAPSVWTFATKEEATKAAVTLFQHWLEQPPQERLRSMAKIALKGQTLVCWCPLDQPCHADVLLDIANA